MVNNQNHSKSDGMFNRILKLPLEGTSSILLFGPRGTGKTSWIKTHLKDALYLDLLEFPLYSSLSTNPQRLENLIPPNFNDWVVLDEVQRIPELLNEVHRLIEAKKLRFILIASSLRPLKKILSSETSNNKNLNMPVLSKVEGHPLVIQELGSYFNLAHVLKFGLLPSVIQHTDPKKYLESYVQTYLREEVLQEGLTRNIGSFTKFLEVASFSQGQVLNVSEIARELGINRLMVASYFEILEDLLLGVRILPFTHRAKRKVIAHQKFYFFDVGVYRVLRPMGPLDTQEEAEGAGLETLFLQSLLAINDYYGLDYKIYFWRTQQGDEVDFVLYGPQGLHAFEIKRSATITNKAFKGLQSFGEEYPEAKMHLVYLGNHTEYHGNITVIPLEQTLKELPNLLA